MLEAGVLVAGGRNWSIESLECWKVGSEERRYPTCATIYICDCHCVERIPKEGL